VSFIGRGITVDGGMIDTRKGVSQQGGGTGKRGIFRIRKNLEGGKKKTEGGGHEKKTGMSEEEFPQKREFIVR